MQSKGLGEALHQERGASPGPLRLRQQQPHEMFGSLSRHAQARDQGQLIRGRAMDILGEGVEEVRLEIKQRHIWPTLQDTADGLARRCQRDLSRPCPLAVNPAVPGFLDQHWPGQVRDQEGVT